MENIEFNGLTCFKEFLKVSRSPLSENMSCLILESDPNPNYYAKGNFPPNKEHVGDRHLYLLVKDHVNCFQDVILRNTNKIKRKFNSKMYIHPGFMSFQNKNISCIRLDATNTDQLAFLINELQNLGIKFLKDQKINDYESFINFKKYIKFEKIEDGIYRDKDNPNRFFFHVNRDIEFNDLVKGMERIKNNCDFHLFDSFLAEIFIDEEMFDFIGIYSKHCDKNRFGELKKEITKQFDKKRAVVI